MLLQPLKLLLMSTSVRLLDSGLGRGVELTRFDIFAAVLTTPTPMTIIDLYK